MKKIFFAIVLITTLFAACNPAPTAPSPAVSPIGKVELSQYVFTGSPGQEWEDAITLFATGADSFAFPGYICSTEDDPYGIARVTTSSGGIGSKTTTFGIRIWESSKPGESCTGVVEIWLYRGIEKYQMTIPVKIVVK